LLPWVRSGVSEKPGQPVRLNGAEERDGLRLVGARRHYDRWWRAGGVLAVADARRHAAAGRRALSSSRIISCRDRRVDAGALV
jgi:hypothetical protein